MSELEFCAWDLKSTLTKSDGKVAEAHQERHFLQYRPCYEALRLEFFYMVYGKYELYDEYIQVN